jgi:hypothetical protein
MVGDKPEAGDLKFDRLKIDKAEVRDLTVVGNAIKSEKPNIVDPKFSNRRRVDNPRKRPKLFRMYPHDRLELCVAAKKRVGRRFLVPVLKRAEVDEPQWYEITYPPGSEAKQKRIQAIDCSSDPAMYVFFERTDYNVKVILVVTKSQYEQFNKKLLGSVEV